MSCKVVSEQCKTCGCKNVYCDTYKGYKQGMDALTEALKLKCLSNVYHSVTLDQIFETVKQMKGE